MSDADHIVHLGENSPEKIALELLKIVADVEGRALNATGDNPADRAYVLRTYSECLHVARGHWHTKG